MIALLVALIAGVLLILVASVLVIGTASLIATAARCAWQLVTDALDGDEAA